MLVLASHQARERLLSKCNEQGIAGLSDFMKEGRLLCCKSESLSELLLLVCFHELLRRSSCALRVCEVALSEQEKRLARFMRWCARRRRRSVLIPSFLVGQETDNEQQQDSEREVHRSKGCG